MVSALVSIMLGCLGSIDPIHLELRISQKIPTTVKAADKHGCTGKGRTSAGVCEISADRNGATSIPGGSDAGLSNAEFPFRGIDIRKHGYAMALRVGNKTSIAYSVAPGEIRYAPAPQQSDLWLDGDSEIVEVHPSDRGPARPGIGVCVRTSTLTVEHARTLFPKIVRLLGGTVNDVRLRSDNWFFDNWFMILPVALRARNAGDFPPRAYLDSAPSILCMAVADGFRCEKHVGLYQTVVH